MGQCKKELANGIRWCKTNNKADHLKSLSEALIDFPQILLEEIQWTNGTKELLISYLNKDPKYSKKKIIVKKYNNQIQVRNLFIVITLADYLFSDQVSSDRPSKESSN
jgi:hypothetical protein